MVVLGSTAVPTAVASVAAGAAWLASGGGRSAPSPAFAAIVSALDAVGLGGCGG